MTKYSTRFEPEARAELRKLPRRTALAILRKLAELENDPFGFGTTPLVGDPAVRRLRTSDHRVLYTVDNGELIVWVIHIGHRATIYRDRPS